VVGPDYRPPRTEVDASFARADRTTAGSEIDRVEAEWWRALGDPVLDELMSRARETNHDLRIAEANLRAARALLRIERRDRLPSATTRASVERATTSAATRPPSIDSTQTLYSARLDATWEIDLFGRVRRSVEAVLAEYGAAEADLRGARVAVAGEVARAYVELTGARRRLEVARANAANQQESLALVRALLDAGRGTELDLERARAQLETTLARLQPLETTEARAIHRLAVLVGEAPSGLDEVLRDAGSIPPAPERVVIGDPASLLRRRPDIAAAERRLAAATARIGVATADLFPRVSLTGSFGSLATSLDELGESAYRTNSFGPFLRWGVFDLGRVRSRLRAAEAGADAALARYEKVVLTALEETENALVLLDRARRRQVHLVLAEQAAARAAELARRRYRAGLDSFLAVLDAEARLLAAQDARAVGAIETSDAYVGLYVALGGGW
jgi:NodT family efflux transporter outer membrane factor (OMF) lipoprotein